MGKETFNTKEKWHTNEEKNAYHMVAEHRGTTSHRYK